MLLRQLQQGFGRDYQCYGSQYHQYTEHDARRELLTEHRYPEEQSRYRLQRSQNGSRRRAYAMNGKRHHNQ